MQKKKFDLTSDIVDIDFKEVSQDEHLPLKKEKSAQPIQNKANIEKKKSVLITISVDEEKRKEYKTWCAKNGLQMNEAFLEGFELLKKQDY